jgi:hypothetical protein
VRAPTTSTCSLSEPLDDVGTNGLPSASVRPTNPRTMARHSTTEEPYSPAAPPLEPRSAGDSRPQADVGRLAASCPEQRGVTAGRCLPAVRPVPSNCRTGAQGLLLIAPGSLYERVSGSVRFLRLATLWAARRAYRRGSDRHSPHTLFPGVRYGARAS